MSLMASQITGNGTIVEQLVQADNKENISGPLWGPLV